MIKVFFLLNWIPSRCTLCVLYYACSALWASGHRRLKNSHYYYYYCCCCCSCWSLLCSAVLRSRADSLRSHVILNGRLALFFFFFFSAFLNIHPEVVHLQRCFVTWLVPRETAAVSARSVYTIQPCTISRHFMQSNIRNMFSCNLPPALLAEWPGSFTCYCGNIDMCTSILKHRC